MALCSAVLIGATVAVAPMTAHLNRPAAAAAAFDFDKGNAVTGLLWVRVGNVIKTIVSPRGNDATLVFRIAALSATAQFDAIAPYHPTAVGIYSDLGRRPASEAATNRNKNIAILYASYRVYSSLVPQASAEWRALLTDVGLDPDDDQENTDTPIGIGNRAGKAVIAARAHDGMNQLGDEGGRKYNRQPYSDYVGYRPVNTAYRLEHPSRWQPATVTKGNGIFTVQQFVTPQMGVTKPFSYADVKDFPVPPPHNSDARNQKGYKQQVDEILATSAGLTDKQKMIAEFFDDKFRGIGFSSGNIAVNKGVSLDRFIEHTAAADIAGFDALIAAWAAKVKYDAVRPWSAVRHVYGGKRVTAWGGPGKGTVRDLPADQWQNYLDVPDHSEYPSGSTSVCAAVAQSGRRTFGTDEITLSFRFAKGASFVEPGITPAADTTLSWTTWSDWMRDCGLSRLYGGVHFKSAIAASSELGPKIGDRAYELVRRHVEGRTGPES
ncbi:vanadium-dependent haloperoxidase [Actinomadura alba]|uniref:Vanadium-dependent haloperoxidase n=1 Tax=Actinomadura alba TaxID=406431 RepID=A0ABR7LV75_9ACTN|nr:vanadium-dependent haloperoxidase [Actinomadura alba]MBC6468355.1 vanadium-dependent haloperoxidase [Actinomadura alba]